MKYITPHWFLLVGGTILVLLSIMGFVGVLGPTAEKSVFGATWWFDNYENLVHAILGGVAILGAFVLPPMWQRYVVFALAALGFFFGVYALFLPEFGPANLENPADTILNLVLGTLALWAAMSITEGEKPAKPTHSAEHQ